MLEEIRLEIAKAKEEYDAARRNESLAGPDYIEIAIESTNIAKMKLNNLYRKAKLLQATTM